MINDRPLALCHLRIPLLTQIMRTMPVKFIVNVPFGLYVFIMFVTFAVAMKVALIMLALLVLYVVWHEPKLFLPPIILGICVRPVAVPVVASILLIFVAQAFYARRKAKRMTALQTEFETKPVPPKPPTMSR